MITTNAFSTVTAPGVRARAEAPRSTGVVRLLLCSPQLMVRQALTTVLSASPRLRVVGDVGNGRDALRWALEVRPDLILLDALLDPVDGMHAASAIHEEAPDLKLVTLRDDEGILGGADDGGAVAIARVSKCLGTQALVQVLLRVAEGEEPGDVPALAQDVRPPVAVEGTRGLKASERLLLALLAGGGDNRLLAERLGCSEKTVRNRLSDLYAKLNLHNRTQAALYAVRSGIVEPAGAELR